MAKLPKKVTYRNKIEAMFGILPSEVKDFDTKKHSRTRPEWLRHKHKLERTARKRNRRR